MIGLTIVLVGLALIGFGIAVKRMGDKVVEEILAAELRQIERDRVNAQHAANVSARWQG